jgi:carbonic anhydrase
MFPPFVVLFLASFLYPSSVAWDYKHNGADWTGLGQCGVGNSQSPIDVPASAQAGKSTVFLKYPEITSSFQLYNNGYSLAFTLPETYKGGFGLGEDASDFEKDGASAYRLWQVNFHSPSEHSFQGQKMPLEMQLMHQRVTGGGPETAVVAVFFTDAANSYNDFLDAFARQLPDSDWGEETIQPPSVPFASIIGGSPFYFYEGSLTVPPCETNVKYYLRQTPLNAANSQLAKFATALQKTCPPKGNFRISQPLSGSIVLVPSVDLVTDPDATAKPAVSGSDDVSGAAVDDVPQEGGCAKEDYDREYKNMGRIAVGDPDYLVKAKESFVRAKRNVQAADASYRSAERSYEMAKALYDAAPGPVEKINCMWPMQNAKTMAANAKKHSDSLKGSVDGPRDEFIAAVNRMCDERRANRTATSVREVAITTPKPLAKAPKPAYVYPEPRLSLPVGLAASPFTDDGSSEAAGSTVGDVKIAPNLHQADVPPAATTLEAAEQTQKVETLTPHSDKMLKISLPISHQSIADEVKFKQDLLNSLAKTANVSPQDLSVTGIHNRSVANVQATVPSLLQRKFPLRRRFLHPNAV